MRVTVEYAFDEAGAADKVDLNPALEFVCGSGDMLPALDEGVRGMEVGETRALRFAVDRPLFGGRDESMVKQLPLDALPPGHGVGDSVFTNLDGGSGGIATVVDMGTSTVTLDFNHPLAGKAASLSVTLLSCEEYEAVEVQVLRIQQGVELRYPRFGDRVTLRFLSPSATEAGFEPLEPVTFKVGMSNFPTGVEEGVGRMCLGERATVWLPAAKSPTAKPLALEVEVMDIDSDLDLAL